LQDTDVIPTGDVLLATLRRLGCRFVIHGHKHFTRLTHVDGVAVLACGSFSAALHEFGTSVGNTFHMVSVTAKQPDDLRGVVHTWVFRFGFGWRRSSLEHAGFPYLTGFGRRIPLTDIIDALKMLAASAAAKDRFLEGDVLQAVPDKGWDATVRFLAENGAELETKDRDGKTPLDYAGGNYRTAGFGGGGVPPSPNPER
jgi:hypothetical protein